MFTIAIIGRPNVGKSTIFNRLTGKKHALVDDRPGVTRDRRESIGHIADLRFGLVDTAGLEEADPEALESRMFMQTEIAVDTADLSLMVIDGRQGLTAMDRHFAQWIRKKNRPVILVINKCEGERGDDGYREALSLGFNCTVQISAEHGEGMDHLYEAIEPYKAEYDYKYGELEIKKEADGGDKFIQLAIIGRPNTGKSTLLNRLYGQERVLTGPEAGITRDSIAIDWKYEDKNVRLIDTAGIRRKSSVNGKIEKLSVADSLRSLMFAHVAILMIDATMPLEKQDLSIAELAVNEGRAVIIAANKWDLIKNKEETMQELRYRVDELLPQIKGAPLIPMSALDGYNVEEAVKNAMKVYDLWNKRVSTGKLNEWLKFAESKHLPPLGKNKKRIRLKYITQGNVRPPTFTVFSNRPQDIPESYKRYIINSIRESFDLPGVPIRVMLRASSNPYKKKR